MSTPIKTKEEIWQEYYDQWYTNVTLPLNECVYNAMQSYADQVTGEGVRWVKASERLPIGRGQKHLVPVKYNDRYYSGFANLDSVQPMMVVYLSFSETIQTRDCEWLDESPLPSTKGEDKLWNNVVATVGAADIVKTTIPDNAESINQWKKKLIDKLSAKYSITLK